MVKGEVAVQFFNSFMPPSYCTRTHSRFAQICRFCVVRVDLGISSIDLSEFSSRFLS